MMVEKAVGILCFSSKSVGFSGILKQRYSDFIVRELNNSRDIARLHSVDGGLLESASFKEVQHVPDPDMSKEERMAQFDVELDRLGGAVVLKEEITTFIFSAMDGTLSSNGIVAFVDDDKNKRSQFHSIVRKYFSTWVETESAKIEEKLAVKIVKQLSNVSRKRKRDSWPSNIGNYLLFVLLKENIDTINAAAVINKTLHLNKTSQLQYNGTKDKRGVTLQWCTVYRKKPSDFAKINSYKFTPTIRVGDFQYVDKPARLGDLAGNRFEIVLRAVDKCDENILDACTQVQENGFINYFGLQRFGKGGTSSHLVGKAIFSSDWKACVDMLFAHRDDDRNDVFLMKECYLRGDFEKAYQTIPDRFHGEKNVLKRLCSERKGASIDYLSAFNGLAKNVRLLCAHAYQSYLWNHAASRRWELGGLQVMKGDVVSLQEGGAALDDMREEIADEEDAEVSHDSPLEISHEAFHIVTEGDIAANRFSIRNVVLPLPGTNVLLPKNEVGSFYTELLSRDGFMMEIYNTCNVTYRMSGTYRRFLQFPDDFSFSILEYSDPNQELATSELANFRNSAESQPALSDVGLKALQLKFSLPPGSYATMLLRELTKQSTETQFQASLSAEQEKYH